MRVLPILFNTEMVRAILDGRKTCTRRICKDANEYTVPDMDFYNADRRTYAGHNFADQEHTEQLSIAERTCPICPGDILYVRETWCALPVNEAGHMRGHSIYYYRADGDLRPEGWRGKWRPSTQMPKEAARIWLKVTDVRVERLQKCGEGWCLDIENEGVTTPQNPILYISDDKFHDALRTEFQKIWNRTIKKSDLDRYGWDANPWVWVVEFERCEKPEDNQN